MVRMAKRPLRKDGEYSTDEYVPVQVYIHPNTYRTFKRRFPKHGAITKLIRKAFELAIREDDDTMERAQIQMDL